MHCLYVMCFMLYIIFLLLICLVCSSPASAEMMPTLRHWEIVRGGTEGVGKGFCITVGPWGFESLF